MFDLRDACGILLTAHIVCIVKAIYDPCELPSARQALQFAHI